MLARRLKGLPYNLHFTFKHSLVRAVYMHHYTSCNENDTYSIIVTSDFESSRTNVKHLITLLVLTVSL